MTTISQIFETALEYQRSGQIHQAEDLYRQILTQDPEHVDALHHLGLASHQLGRSEEATLYLRRAVRLNPGFAEAHNSLGVALHKAGKLEDAAQSYRRALDLRLDLAHVHNNLGLVLTQQVKFEEAESCYRRALLREPRDHRIHNSLGYALKQQGKLAEAMGSYHEALRHQPDYAIAHSNLGTALLEQGQLHEAAARFETALAIDPRLAEAHNGLGLVQQEQGRLAQAFACFRRALEVRPGFIEALVNIGRLHEEEGSLDEARAAFDKALQVDPNHVPARAQRAVRLRGRLPETDRAILEDALTGPFLTEADRAEVHFALAAVYDAQRSYAQAADHSRRANAVRLALSRRRHDASLPDTHRAFVDRLIATFTPGLIERMNGYGLDTEMPVFIVGLPRSGTSLTEQILASHSRVFGAGELTLAQETFVAMPEVTKLDRAPLDCVPDLDRRGVQALARSHLDRLLALGSSAARVVDKMFNNYLYLGFLAVLFPRGRFIHCRRDLRDTALSCWMTDFTRIRWANDPGHIATHFGDYERLMEHWRRALPVTLLDVSYEEMVNDLEGTARRLIDWCELEWEPACLEFHKTQRPVQTASATQVRQTLYATSVGRWHNYAAVLPDLFRDL
ncbi:MAG: tetratricopeptide repeat-containing sulfotransferase family protein [Isosphaeraceae bacterium]